MRSRFRDRFEAGRRLADELAPRYAGRNDVIVLGLPRGGVPVAYEVARTLRAPLDVFVVRKLGVPGHEELAMGAIASGGVRVLDEQVIVECRVGRRELDLVTERERRELERRERRYRDGQPFAEVRGRTAILVDDGLATGSTMRAAVEALRREGPAAVVVAVPVAPLETCEAFREVVDDIVCAVTPEPFVAVGLWYEDFSQTTDEEVHELLARASGRGAMTDDGPGGDGERTVRVQTGDAELEGTLAVPRDPRGVVLFAHGSGSSRHSPRNRFVARELRAAGLATLLLDLLTPAEEAVDERTRALRFDIGLLASRLVGAIWWLDTEPATRGLPVGLFGASTGGGAALVAAARMADHVRAVVSRGGRPDLAGDDLLDVRCPVLLIVGERDPEVIDLNERAMAHMTAPVRLEIVPGATHLFEEPGALEQVARMARDWFAAHLGAAGRRPAGVDAPERRGTL
ncbi:MAG: alpha/beta family hydrolase [Gemmatimonadaceae bacterium]